MASPASKFPARKSPASLASALAVLADNVRRHPDSPERLHEAVDRMAFRIRDTEDLFQFCPSHGELPVGAGTMWGLICESPPVAAGVLVRCLFTERLGEEYDLSQRHADAVLFALDEYPENLALFEIVARCPRVLKAYSEREDGVFHMAEAWRRLQALVPRAPAARVGANCGCVGITSGVLGVRDSDAFFVEGDLCRGLLDVLLSPACSPWPKAAIAAGGTAAEAVCASFVLVADIAAQMQAHPQVLAKAFAYLSSALPQAFKLDEANTNGDLWTFLHMLASSSFGNFIEDVLDICGSTRMHDTADLRAARARLFGAGRPEGKRRYGKAALGDIRLVFCHVLILMLHALELMAHRVGQPERFVEVTAALFRTRFLPVLQRALDGAAASRWVQVREALAALVAAAERAPTEAGGASRLRDVRVAFMGFAATRFVPVEGAVGTVEAEALLDPLAIPLAAAAAPDLADLFAQAAAGPAGDAFLRWRAREQGREPAQAVSQKEVKAILGQVEDPQKDFPLGHPPRQPGMRLFDGAKPPPPPPEPAAVDPKTVLPRPLPQGNTYPSLGRKAVARGVLPPLNGAMQARGFFFDTRTSQYIRSSLT